MPEVNPQLTRPTSPHTFRITIPGASYFSHESARASQSPKSKPSRLLTYFLSSITDPFHSCLCLPCIGPTSCSSLCHLTCAFLVPWGSLGVAFVSPCNNSPTGLRGKQYHGTTEAPPCLPSIPKGAQVVKHGLYLSLLSCFDGGMKYCRR